MEFDRLELLERLLKTTLKNIDYAMREDPTKTASLIKEARFIGKEIAEIRGETGTQKQAEQRTPVDELRQRREDRKRGRA
ncbi:hypothetical protein V3M69_00895 [Trueperella pyogenes]|uniref:Uncharacterized protein n=1 Tax=Trueperella pyogenes TaxID=1661 RepID=A0A3Q9GLM1_9ACTO|nr:hypothetical protein [Trueperella pyogenes]AZR06364.1 hypothetical protein EBQ10_03025 [Trueperella pyogenes]QIU87085.1 hypothetical protein HEP79_07590 [Trueperella pyogenes]